MKRLAEALPGDRFGTDQSSHRSTELSQATIFVVDEDPEVCRRISDLATAMNLRCEAYSSGLDFLDTYDRQLPGCLVMEFRMMAISGLQIQRRLASRGSIMPIVFLTAHAEVTTVVKAMRLGAIDVLDKTACEQTLWDAILEAVQLGHKRWQLQQQLRQLSECIATLTAKDREVIRRIGQNKTKSVIATELGVCIRTVEVRCAKLVTKLGLDSSLELKQVADVVCGSAEKTLGGTLNNRDPASVADMGLDRLTARSKTLRIPHYLL